MSLNVGLVLAVPLAWIVSAQAASIGRDRTRWFVFSLLLLPVAILVLIPLAYSAGRRDGATQAPEPKPAS